MTIQEQNKTGKENALLDVKDLVVEFQTPRGVVRALDKVSFSISKGKTLGVVGESGCGKSVTALSLMGLVPSPPGSIPSGTIHYDNNDLLKATEKEMREIRGNHLSMIFQEPMTSLNPVFKTGEQVAEALRLHQRKSRKEAKAAAIEMFRLTGIPSPEERVNNYPHQMSGGMRQRVMIAMALACKPKLLIADEPTTALDVTIQAQILDLLKSLSKELGMSIMLITHDLGVVAETCEHVLVMYAGRVVEKTDTQTLFKRPRHPYTVGLMNSMPGSLNGSKTKRLQEIPGMVPSLHQLPLGCKFQDRCSFVQDKCRQEEPALIPLGKTEVRCHFAIETTA